MVEAILYKDEIFKKYDFMYWVSADGKVYSSFAKRLLKYHIDLDGYPRVDIHGKHMKIHKLVYLTWIGEIPEGLQVNHKNDDKMDNHFTNLYVGDQFDNIQDKINNGHAVGNIFYLTILDKQKNRIMTFCPSSDFILYSGHPCENGSVSRMFRKNWFKERFEVIDFRRIKNLEQFLQLKGVSTIPDECKGVEWN